METITQKAEYGLNRGNLKMIALFCMAIDHIGLAIVESWILKLSEDSMMYMFASLLDLVLRLIGRLAFPIFCFFIVEGFRYTRNIYFYALRLIFVGAVSEIPFNMMREHQYFSLQYQNVFLTLLIGLVAIHAIDGIFKKFKINEAGKYILTSIVSISAFALAEVLKTDYSSIGVLSIILIYLIGEKKYNFALFINLFGQLSGFIGYGDFSIGRFIYLVLSLMIYTVALYICRRIPNNNSQKMYAAFVALTCLNFIEFPTLVNMWLMQFYNNKKGKKIDGLFYCFYPAHMLILSGLCALLGLY